MKKKNLKKIKSKGRERRGNTEKNTTNLYCQFTNLKKHMIPY